MRALAGSRIAKINLLRQRNGERCGVCGHPIRFDLYSKRDQPHVAGPSIDHIVKLAEGGCNHERNVQLTHTGCNNWRDFFGTPGFFELFQARIAPLLKCDEARADI